MVHDQLQRPLLRCRFFHFHEKKLSVLSHMKKIYKRKHTGSPCNSRILGEMKIRELQNREFQGPLYMGLNVP